MSRAAQYDWDVALDAALSLFWEKGYHATSLKDLETALDMKPGSIYAAFFSKKNLYLLTLERYFQRSRTGFRTKMKHARSPLLGLAAYFQTYAQLGPNDKARQVCMLTKTLLETRTTEPEIFRKSYDYMAAMHLEFSSCFAQAIAQKELPAEADPDRLARRFQANIMSLRLELTRGATAHEVLTLAEDMGLEISGLRIVSP